MSFVRQLEILCSHTSGFEKLPCRRPSWRSDERNGENTYCSCSKTLYHTCWLSDLACLLDLTWFCMIWVFFPFFRKRILYVSCVEFFTIWINQSAAQSARSNRQYQLKGPTWRQRRQLPQLGPLAASFPTDFLSVFQPWQHTMVSCIASVKCANIHISSIKTRTDFECRYFFTYSSRNLQEILGIQL